MCFHYVHAGHAPDNHDDDVEADLEEEVPEFRFPDHDEEAQHEEEDDDAEEHLHAVLQQAAQQLQERPSRERLEGSLFT